MKVADFDFPFDPSRIAQRPIEPRDAARLLDLSGADPAHRHIWDLPNLIGPEDLVVVNNTRVLPARLFGYRDQVAIEATLVRQVSQNQWWGLVRPGRRLKINHRLKFAPGLEADVSDKNGAEVLLTFNRAGPDLHAALIQQGTMPLPPYIKRDRGGDVADHVFYQSPFAKYDGAVAAPTASLHFTSAVRSALPCPLAEITLHVGLGTFAGVKVTDTDDHVMHHEWGNLPAQTAIALDQCRARGGRDCNWHNCSAGFRGVWGAGPGGGN